MKNLSIPMAAALMGGLIAASATVPQAGAAEGYYKGKTVKINVGFHPGGGYDTYARLVARHIGRFLPGNPSVLTINFPGAGSLRLANYIYNRAPKNGMEVGIFASSAAFGPLYLVKQAKFETKNSPGSAISTRASAPAPRGTPPASRASRI
jgi:tripartite-type tricarboxylate transporter receptor subunit TctC